MTNKYSNYFAEFFEIIFSTSKELENEIDFVNLELKKVTIIGKKFFRIYINIKLKNGKYVEFHPEKKYISYHIPDDEKYEFKSSHPIHRVHQDMFNVYYLIKNFIPNLKIDILDENEKSINR